VCYVETVYTICSMHKINKNNINIFSLNFVRISLLSHARYMPLFFPMPAICLSSFPCPLYAPPSLSCLFLLPQIMFSYDYKLGKCVRVFFFQCAVAPSHLLPLVGLKISPQYSVFKHHRLVSSFSLRDQLSNSHINDRQTII